MKFPILLGAWALLSQEGQAFSLRKPIRIVECSSQRQYMTRRGAPPSLKVTAEVNTVADIQEAVAMYDELNGDEQSQGDVVQVTTEMMTSHAISKEDLMKDVQEMMEAEPLVVLPDPDEEKEEESPIGNLLSDIASKLSFFEDTPPALEENTDMEKAASSASLYMNPATAKIASHVQITWEPDVAETLERLAKVSNPQRPFMVGIVGIPGSGKSTSAEIIQAMLGEDRSLVMPMDGFHIPLAELAELENAADAIYRRGAPDTFHASGLKDQLKRIVYGDEASVSVPGFDHAVGDPTPDQHTFHRKDHKIVLCEGLYLLHDDDGWEDIRSFFDWTIYIDADVDICVERLKERNKCIPVSVLDTHFDILSLYEAISNSYFLL